MIEGTPGVPKSSKLTCLSLQILALTIDLKSFICRKTCLNKKIFSNED